MRHVAGVLARDRVASYGTKNGAVPSLYVDVEPLSLDHAGFAVGDEVVVVSAADFARLGTSETWEQFAAWADRELTKAILP